MSLSFFFIKTYLSLHEQPISDNVWQLWPLLCQMLLSWAADYMSETLAVFDNMISRATDRFLTIPNAMNMLLHVYNEYMSNPKRSEYSAGAAAQIMEVVLVYCRGRVDGLVRSRTPSQFSTFQ